MLRMVKLFLTTFLMLGRSEFVGGVFGSGSTLGDDVGNQYLLTPKESLFS